MDVFVGVDKKGMTRLWNMSWGGFNDHILGFFFKY